MNKRNIAVTLECFVKKGDKYLMLHRRSDKRIMPDVWMAPGGHREFNEGLFECASREIKEETGLRIKNIRIRAVGNGYLKDLDQEIHFHHLLADYAGGMIKSKIEDGELIWLTKNEILKLDNLLTELKKTLHHLLSDNEKVISYKVVYEKGNNMKKFILETP